MYVNVCDSCTLSLKWPAAAATGAVACCSSCLHKSDTCASMAMHCAVVVRSCKNAFASGVMQ
jgi:hypothetical protein